MANAISDSPPNSILQSVLAPLFAVAKEYPEAEEIVVNRPGEVMVECAGQWEAVSASNLTFAGLRTMALAVAQSTAQSFNEKTAVLFGTLPTGERLTFVGPPIVEAGTVSLTMRLANNTVRRMSAYDGSDFFDHFRWAQKDAVLAKQEKLPADKRELVDLLAAGKLREFLMEGTRRRLTMGMLGDTGSGKTFLMECLIQSIPESERLITIESARELRLPAHRNKVQMLYSHFGTGASALDAAGLMQVTKRMKPDRVILGECIGPEAFVFQNMVVSGHPGSITSWHAKSIAVARERFVLMCREHEDAKAYTPQDLRELFDLTMDVMVHIHVDKHEPDPKAPRKRRFVRDVWFDPFLSEGK
jgi:type IV secretion system protein VirB11